MKDKRVFGEFIKTKRIEKNYSQKELAELLYVTDSAVSKWERGIAYPDITLITDICRVLEITEHELIESTQDENYRKFKKDSEKYTKIKKSLFWTINIMYITALVVCFIVNLAVNHTLSWFFIVLTSIICAYTFCPTITWIYPKYKNIILLGSTFISLFLLYLTISIVFNNYWFMIATLGTLIFYFIVFYPILFNLQKKYIKDDFSKLSKWFMLSYVVGILVLILLLLVAVRCYVQMNLGLGMLITLGISIIPIILGFIKIFRKGNKIIMIVLYTLLSIVIVLILVALVRGIIIKASVVSKTYEITETYNKIKIDSKTYDIKICKSNNDETKIVCTEDKNNKIEYKIVDGELIITHIDERKFYEFLFNFSSLEIEVYVPSEKIDTLIINSNTGDIEVNNECTYNSIKITNSTGNISIAYANILGNVELKCSTGDININNTNCGSLDIKISTGNTVIKNSIVNGDFNMIGSTGYLRFEDFDANNIRVLISTGNVSGVLLSHKFFIVKSSTGNIDVPETRDGGECRITTSTGNIKIRYKE